MRWAKTHDGLDIYYELTGTSGPVLVFQSGFMGIHDIWKYQVEALSSSFRCITHDNRGYGLSSKPEGSEYYTAQLNADDINAVLNDAQIDEPYLLITHSMGGFTSLTYAASYPHSLQGILMMGGAALSGEPLKASGADENVFARFHTSPAASTAFYHNLGLRQDIAIEAGKWPRHVFTHQTKAMLEHTADEKIRGLTLPVLVLHGDSDVVTPVEHPKEVANTLLNGRLQMLDDVNHFPQTENPTLINAIIRSFAQELHLSN